MSEARGEAGRSLEVELLLDILAEPLYYQVLFGRAPFSRRMAADVVESVLRIAHRD